ncbi:hypothetical protein [Burkholderia ubonensis]|nr:hypothetical protein [Burkholderia ubonensis]
MRGLKPETVAQAVVDGVLRSRPVVAVGADAHALRFAQGDTHDR